MWHVMALSALVLAHGARLAWFFQHRSEVFFAFLLIRFAIVRGRIIPRMEMRRSTSGSLEHLVPFQRKKFLVPPRTPGKGVDAIEAEHVIDAEKMEAAPDAADTLPPPIEFPATHHIRVNNWDSPVLSPFLSELIVFKMSFRRRATAPVMRKFIRPRENVRAVIIDAERNVP